VEWSGVEPIPYDTSYDKLNRKNTCSNTVIRKPSLKVAMNVLAQILDRQPAIATAVTTVNVSTMPLILCCYWLHFPTRFSQLLLSINQLDPQPNFILWCELWSSPLNMTSTAHCQGQLFCQICWSKSFSSNVTVWTQKMHRGPKCCT